MASRPKVLLVFPGDSRSFTKRLPLSVLYLAETLLQDYFDPLILDTQVDEFSEEMLKGVSYVGISCLTGEQINSALDIASKIRALNPTIPLVWGGIHASITPEQTIAHPLVDYIIQWEGEVVFPRLLKALQNHVAPSEVENCVYREGDRVCMTPRAPFLDFNKRNNLPYDLLSLSKYQTATRIEYQSSRGCPNGCIFCYNKQFNLFKWRCKDPAIVLDEMEALKKRFNSTYLHLADDEFFIHKRRAREIIKGMVERQLDFLWTSFIRINTFNSLEDDFLDLIYSSGCYQLNMGAESGSINTLELIRKNIKPEDILVSARKARDTKIIIQYSFMAGFPGETINDLHKTIDSINEIQNIGPRLRVNGLFFVCSWPGTDMFELAVKNGYSPPKSLEEWGHVDQIMSVENFPYLSKSFIRELQAFGFLVRFRFLWMYSASFIAQKKNRKSIKYWLFIVFHIVLKPFDILFRIRWKTRFFSFPLDMAVVKNTLFKASE